MIPPATAAGTASLDLIAHIVQIALTPVFLLSGVVTLLNVCAQRLARVADKVDHLMESGTGLAPQLARLRLRSRILDFAVVLASLAGLLTCGAALTLFLGAIRARAEGDVLFGLFGGAIGCTMAALGAFVLETLISSRTTRDTSERAEAELRR